jgi:hypothetical protein
MICADSIELLLAVQWKVRKGLIVLKNSMQRKTLQNIGTLFPQISAQETMFAKAALGGKKF